jgi:hypothetical protein
MYIASFHEQSQTAKLKYCNLVYVVFYPIFLNLLRLAHSFYSTLCWSRMHGSKTTTHIHVMW